MASANAPSLKGAHAQRGLCEPWESTTLIRTLPKRAKRQHSDTRENPSLCFQQFTPTPRKHGLVVWGLIISWLWSRVEHPLRTVQLDGRGDEAFRKLREIILGRVLAS